MTNNKVSKILILTLTLSILIVGCSKKDKTEEKEVENYIPVEIQKINKETLENSRTFTGQVIPNNEVMVIPKMVGSVDSVNVELGDYVEKGETLFTINTDEINKNLEQSQMGIDMASQGVDQAKNAVDTAKASKGIASDNLKQAENDFNHINNLYKEGTIPKSQLEQAEFAVSFAESQLKTLDSQIVQANNGLEQANAQVNQAEISHNHIMDSLKDSNVKAPISGLVAHLDVKQDEIVTNTQPAAIIIDTDKLFVQIQVVEDLINSIEEGQSSFVSIPAAFDEKIESTISYVSQTADVANKLYSVKSEIDNIDGLVKPGMTGKVTLNIDELEDVISLPRDTILESEKDEFVFIVKDGKAVKRKIVTGSNFGDFVIIKKGISLGDEVITKGQHYVENGVKVKIVGGDD